MKDLSPGINSVFSGPFEEGTKGVTIEGKLPSELKGDYFLVAPGCFRRGGQPLSHWLDGDGLLNRLSFDAGAARFENRFVRTEKFTREQSEAAFRFRGFGAAEGLLDSNRAIATPANVTVCTHADKLLVFGEQSLPWKLDPSTLSTEGEHHFDGQLSGWHPMGAHHKVDPQTQELFCFGIRYQPTGTELIVYRFDRRGRLIYHAPITLPGPHYLHDFLISQDYLGFHLSPYYFRLERFARGASLLESLEWESGGSSELLLCDRKTGRPVGSAPCPPGFSVHTINAFNDGPKLVADFISFDRPFFNELHLNRLFNEVPKGRPYRLIVDMDSCQGLSTESLPYSHAPDFPHVAMTDLTRRYQRFFALGISHTGVSGRKFYDELLRFDWAHGDVARFCCDAGTLLCGEPTVLAGTEGDYVLCQAFVAGQSCFLLFGADRLTHGPVARIHLSEPIPPGLHTAWKPLG